MSYVVHRAQIRVLSRVGEGFLRDLRVRVFEHLSRLSMPFYDRNKAGVLVSRMTSDVDSLQELVQTGLLTLIGNGLLLVFSALVLALVSFQLLLACLVAVPFVVLASVRFARRSSATYLTVRDRIGQNLSRLQEGISGVRVIQAFAREPFQIERFAESNQALYARAHGIDAPAVVVPAGDRDRRHRHDRAGRRGRRISRARGTLPRSAP